MSGLESTREVIESRFVCCGLAAIFDKMAEEVVASAEVGEALLPVAVADEVTGAVATVFNEAAEPFFRNLVFALETVGDRDM
jgi:hypothetical protein